MNSLNTAEFIKICNKYHKKLPKLQISMKKWW